MSMARPLLVARQMSRIVLYAGSLWMVACAAPQPSLPARCERSCDLAAAIPPDDGGAAERADLGSASDGSGSGDDLARAPADLAPPATADLSDNGTIPPGAPIGWCDSAHWTASASASSSVNPPSYAIDGLQPTRWSTGVPQAVGQYLQLDFGGFVMLSQLTIVHTFVADGKDDYARGLDVLVSYDGVDFSRTLASATWSADPGTVTIDFPAHAARYLRLRLSQGATTSWWSIHDLTLGCQAPGGPDGGAGGPANGVPSGPTNPNVANWVATALRTNPGDVVTNAFDGNAATRWSTGSQPQVGDEWFKIDMGASYSITQLSLTASGGDVPSAYELDLSTDNATFTPVARGLGSDTTTIGFPRQTARYVLIKQIGTGYDHWWSISELTVYQ
jgi:hypothetical protein